MCVLLPRARNAKRRSALTFAPDRSAGAFRKTIAEKRAWRRREQAERFNGHPHRFAALAQLVEHLICNQGVGGSSPSGGTNEIK